MQLDGLLVFSPTWRTGQDLAHGCRLLYDCRSKSLALLLAYRNMDAEFLIGRDRTAKVDLMSDICLTCKSFATWEGGKIEK